MGKQVREVIFDSLTNKEIEGEDYTETRISVNGTFFTLYLTPDSEKKFQADVEKWTQYETPESNISAPARRITSTRGAAKTDKAQLAAIREWARENGHEVSDRGRISQTIQDAYQEAHKN